MIVSTCSPKGVYRSQQEANPKSDNRPLHSFSAKQIHTLDEQHREIGYVYVKARKQIASGAVGVV